MEFLNSFSLVVLVLFLAVVIWLVVISAPMILTILWTHIILLFTGRLKEVIPLYKATGEIFRRHYREFKEGK